MLPVLTTGLTNRRSGEVSHHHLSSHSSLYYTGNGLDSGGETGGAGQSSLSLTAQVQLSVTRRVRTSAAASGATVGETGNTVAVQSVSTTETNK